MYVCIIGAHSELPGGGYGKLTNILTTRHYDHSASSSFPALNECYSPLTVSDERHSERQSLLETIRKQITSDNRFDWFHIKVDLYSLHVVIYALCVCVCLCVCVGAHLFLSRCNVSICIQGRGWKGIYLFMFNPIESLCFWI